MLNVATSCDLSKSYSKGLIFPHKITQIKQIAYKVVSEESIKNCGCYCQKGQRRGVNKFSTMVLLNIGKLMKIKKYHKISTITWSFHF